MKVTNSLLLIALLSCSSFIRASETIKVCAVNWPPFSFVEESKTIKKGLSVELYNEAFARMGKKIEFFHVPWGRCEKSVFAGEFDAILDSVKVEGLVNADTPTAFYPLGAYVTEQNELQEFSWTEVNNKIVGLVMNYHYADIILDYQGWQALPVETEEKLIALLGKNRVNFAILDYFSVVDLSKKVGVNTRLLKPLIVSQNLYLLFNDKHQELTKQLNSIIQEMLKDGTIDRIYLKYWPESYSAIYEQVKLITVED